MKSIKFITPAILGGFMSFMMLSCSKSDPYTPPAGGDSDYKVSIQAAQFSPSTITMLPGAKLTWTNTDADVHSVVSDDATSFNSGNIPAGGTFSFTPASNGTYEYHCGIHPAVKGTIYVVSR